MLGGALILVLSTSPHPFGCHSQPNLSARILPRRQWNPRPTKKRGNGRPIDNTMASKDESSKTQRTNSPQAEHTSPKKRRKVNHGGYD